MFVWGEGDFGMLGWALKILKSPSEEKQPNLVAVGCNGCNAGAAVCAPSEQGDRGLSVKAGGEGNVSARSKFGKACADQ